MNLMYTYLGQRNLIKLWKLQNERERERENIEQVR